MSVRAGAALLACCISLGGCAAGRGSSGTAENSPSSAPTATPAPIASGSTSAGVSQAASTVSTVQARRVEQYSGRLSLRVHQPDTGATDGGTLLFEFEGHSDEGALTLQTVIGTAVAEVRWNPQGAEVVTPRGRRAGQTLDEVATALLGQALPLAAILQWVRAEPWPLAPHQRHTQGFDQLGWSVSLEAWHERVVTARRPANLDRRNDLDITVRARLDEPAEAPAGTSP